MYHENSWSRQIDINKIDFKIKNNTDKERHLIVKINLSER